MGERITIEYHVPQTWEIDEEQVVSGSSLINRIESEITSQLTAVRLPDRLRESFLKGHIRVFNTDIDAWVIVRTVLPPSFPV